MDRITMLGTGNALVTRCYNTCFVMDCGQERMLVDAGGGNGVLRQLEQAQIPVESIHTIYLTHSHTDHILGMVWVLRMIATAMRKGKYEGELRFYAFAELIDAVRTICSLTLPRKLTWLFDHRILFIPVYDGDLRTIMGRQMQFFDIQSTKARQFGFTIGLADGQKLICCGDEPLPQICLDYAAGCGWMMHEAFCLHSQADIYSPYEKHHSTVKEACSLAQELEIPNLILYHTEDDNLNRRKELYTAEGRLYYHGSIYVPDDLDVIEPTSGT